MSATQKVAYISETFISLEGEGPYTGQPTIYVRFAGCNLRCKGFNNPNLKDVLDFNPKDYTNINDLPPISRGCDSNYSVDATKFKHLWRKVTPMELYNELVELSITKTFKSIHGLNYNLSITGGEPTIHQPFLIELFNIIKSNSIWPDKLIIETNATIDLKTDFLNSLSGLSKFIPIIWANSLKLSNSGEDINKTINYNVLIDQIDLDGEVQQYFKFVTNGSDKILSEIMQCIKFAKHSIDIDSIFLMPEACNYKQLVEVGQIVAKQCIDNGYTFCNRLQNVLWDNQIGT